MKAGIQFVIFIKLFQLSGGNCQIFIMISKKEVEKLAFLGRVELTDEELENVPEELEAILKYVQKLSEVDTEKTEPFFHFSETSNVFREDLSRKEDNGMKEEVKKTKEHKNNYLKVKSIWG